MRTCLNRWHLPLQAEQSYKKNPKLLQQFHYCEEHRIPLAVVIGESEIQAGVVKLRNVATREEVRKFGFVRTAIQSESVRNSGTSSVCTLPQSCSCASTSVRVLKNQTGKSRSLHTRSVLPETDPSPSPVFKKWQSASFLLRFCLPGVLYLFAFCLNLFVGECPGPPPLPCSFQNFAK